MLTKRIIPCLDVKNGRVVKGIKFQQHQVVGDILQLAEFYSQAGADELVFYDITASSDNRAVDYWWVQRVAQVINIPFCVAGGIRDVQTAEKILHAGADKISINSPALENPNLIDQLVNAFGQQCIVIGVDSLKIHEQYQVYQYTGDINQSKYSGQLTIDWIKQVQDHGAGEIVLNCMNCDGVKTGYDIVQLQTMRAITKIPLIASGGAGQLEHFYTVFKDALVDGALAASVFHSSYIQIPPLKEYLIKQSVEVRL